MPVDPSVPRAVKQPGESRLYDFDFSNLLASGATLVASPAPTVTQQNQGLVAGSAALTLGAPAVASPKVQVRIGGGTHLEDYKVSVVAQDSLGNTLEADGLIQVREL